MNKQNGKISSPEATGGAGTFFEQHVNAMFLARLLVRGLPPVLTDCQLEEVHFQTEHLGWETDDVLLVGLNAAGERRQLAGQVKKSFTVSSKNEDCKKTFGDFWKDFQDDSHFNKDRDRLAIITLRGTETLLGHLKALLNCARTSLSATDCSHRITTEGYLRQTARRHAIEIRTIVEATAGGTVSDDEFWEFLKVIHVLSFDLNTAEAQAEAEVKTLLANTTGEQDKLGAAAVSWGELLQLVGLAMPIAGSYTRDHLPASLRQRHSGIGTVEQAALLGLKDHYVVLAHSERAEHELSLLLMQRSISPDRVRQGLIALAQSVTDGDLRYVERSVRPRVLYWSARIHAMQPETLPVARSYLDQLRQSDPGADRRIVAVLILEAEGNVDGALRILRDIDTPDGRATFFRTLFRGRGEEIALSWFDDQPERDNASFLTGIGWSNVALCLVKMSRWEEAADRLAAAQEQVEAWPDLAFVEGVVNAAMLLPVEWRQYALEMNVFHEGMRPIEGAEADRRRARAKVCFEKAANLLVKIDQHNRAHAAQDWLLWLRLTDPTPEVVHQARQGVQEGMKEGQSAVDLILFARAFGIEFDAGPLERYLLHRARTGGLVGGDLLAELLLAELKMTPRDYADFLGREENRFCQVVPNATLAGMRVEALVRDGQIVRARNLLEERRDDFIDYDYERLRAMIDAQEGSDPRAQLEALYLQTDSLLDLRNLIAHLGQARDWMALQPLLQELFRRERTVENALRLVEGMRRSPQLDYANPLAFLEEHQDMVDRSLELASEKAWALSHVGQLKEAEAINQRLLQARDNQIDLILEINLVLQSGDWERFPLIISSAWPKRQGLDPSMLIRLASLAAEADTTASRALDLAKLAVSKAPDDPDILMSAYVLAVQLGREEETGGEWIARASELSSNEGPVWKVHPRTIVEEMMPKRREHGRKIDQALVSGRLSLHAAAHMLNQPLSRFLIDIPRRNADRQDGRRRMLVPIISGARQITQINPEWAVGFDVTSLMVLGHLDLLSRTMNAFQRVVLAPETMILLLNERRRVRFHQPSRIEQAEEVRALIDQGSLRMEQSLPKPPEWLVDEVGRDLAEILEAARVAGGRVVHPSPIHKLKTFLEGEAELRDYAEFVLSTRAFTSILFERGFIDTMTHERACQFLRAHDHDPNTDADPSLIDRPLYLDDLAVAYLQKAGLLQAACHCGLHLFVHPSTKADQSALIEENREGNRLAKTLDDIRVMLRDALARERAVFLPRHHWNDEARADWFYQEAPTLAQILRDARLCEAACIDDRFLNKNGILTDETGHTVPLVCVVDLLQHLEAHGMRQTFMRIRSLNMVELPAEARFLERMQLGCIEVIRRLWADEALPTERVVALSDWVWRNVAPSPLDWAKAIREPLRTSDISEAFARHLALLLRPMHLNTERYVAFRDWVECEIWEPLLPANADLVDRLVGVVRTEIERLSEELSDDESSTAR